MISDEDAIAIPLADRISFSPAHPNLPLRGLHHPALPSYIARLSITLFGVSQLGYRALSVFAGLFCLVLMFRLTRSWYGTPAALWTVALLAFNEYHIIVSSLATAKGPHLLFVTTAIYAFARFLTTARASWLYGAIVAVGLAFYCKEHSVLLLVAFGLTLLLPAYRHWIGRRHVWLAAALFLALITPDIVANFYVSPDPATLVTTRPRASYRDHLARIGGIGLTPYPLMFFVRDGVTWVAGHVAGSPIDDATPEYPSMNVGFGLILLAAVCARSFQAGAPHRRFLPILFWVVFGFFTIISPGQPANNMDAVTWYWTDAALFPAVILGGSLLAAAAGWKWPLRIAAVAAMIYAVIRLTVLSE